jgi:medium-chain acyl-[acyl-carrier-protein] hydrolase
VITLWLVRPKPNLQARLRLFCFPYAGGGTLPFYTWPRALPDDVEVCLVRAAARNLLPYLDKPFALFGHSMGSLISFELARLLRKENGISPRYLFASGHRAPQLPPRGKSIVHKLPEPEFMEELRRLNGTPKSVLDHPELMRILIPVLRADFEVVETYVYLDEPPLECPIMAFGGLNDPEATQSELEAWRTQTNAMFSLKMFPGDHFYLNDARPLLLQTLSQCLEQLALLT